MPSAKQFRVMSASVTLTKSTDTGWNYTVISLGNVTAPDGRAFSEWELRCVRCGRDAPLPPCANCGGTRFDGQRFSGDADGIYCQRCKLSWSRWKCSACGTSNPYDGSTRRVSIEEIEKVPWQPSGLAAALGFIAGITWTALVGAWLFSIASRPDARIPTWLVRWLGQLHPLLVTVCFWGSPFAVGIATARLVDRWRKT